MKKLGLIGGTGPQSTMPYYLGIVYGVKEKVGQDFFPPLTIESVDVYHILDLCAREELNELTGYFLKAIGNLVAAGAEFVALSANTSHIVYDELQRLSPVKVLSIIEVTADEAQKRGFRKVALLGTRFTMQKDFYKKPFIGRGIDVVIPDEKEMTFVDKKIMDELELGVVNENTRSKFIEIIRRLKDEEGAEAVILGCTELPMILNDEVSPIPCLDTVDIHIRAIVDGILND